jgi:hypothetical protein
LSSHFRPAFWRFGPGGANLATLCQAGLPTPGSFCVDAEAYRRQVSHPAENRRGAFATDSSPQARRYALDMKLGLMDKPPDIERNCSLQASAAEKSSADRRTFSALVEPLWLQLCQPVRKFSISKTKPVPHRGASCWAALWIPAPLHSHPRHRSAKPPWPDIQPLVKARPPAVH